MFTPSISLRSLIAASAFCIQVLRTVSTVRGRTLLEGVDARHVSTVWTRGATLSRASALRSRERRLESEVHHTVQRFEAPGDVGGHRFNEAARAEVLDRERRHRRAARQRLAQRLTVEPAAAGQPA